MQRRYTTEYAMIRVAVAVCMAFLAQPVVADDGLSPVALDALEDNADEGSSNSVRWNPQMDPVAPITVLAGRGVAAAGAGAGGIACPGGGTVATLCRDDHDGTVMATTVTACRLKDDDGRVLSVSGELLITAPIAGGCATGILPECAHVSVRAVRYVATISDAAGTVLDTISMQDRTTILHDVLLPCDARASR